VRSGGRRRWIDPQLGAHFFERLILVCKQILPTYEAVSTRGFEAPAAR
jgi:hypothetical protein